MKKKINRYIIKRYVIEEYESYGISREEALKRSFEIGDPYKVIITKTVVKKASESV